MLVVFQNLFSLKMVIFPERVIHEPGFMSESGLGGQYDNKRALYNAMERKRRDSIKDSFRGQYIHRFLSNSKFRL